MVSDVRVRLPVRGPVAEGEKVIWMKQEALGASGPLHTEPPVVEVEMAKSPVVTGGEIVTVVGA